MPNKAKTPTKTPAAKASKAAAPAKTASPAPAAEAKPAEAAPAKPAPAKAAKPAIPGRPDQPTWAKFNKGPAQKMAKGRPFRHQGR